MNKLMTVENIAGILAKSRESCGKSQKYMARAMGKSIGTVQNWEYGYSSPSIIELVEWFDVLGLNPLRHLLNALHPDQYKELTKDSESDEIRNAVIYWISDIASDAAVRKLAYCMFGETGSSFEGQLDEWCALNHLPLMDRINVADNISSLYSLRKMRNELRGNDHIQPNIDNLNECIYASKVAVINNKEDYTN